MLPGFSGHLLAEAFLEQQLSAASQSDASGPLRLLTGWRRQSRALGPATSLRALVDAGAAPLAHALGFDSLEHIEFSDTVATATLTGVSPPVAALVLRWGERLDPFWRRAVTESHRRGAVWCLLFNGTHARLIEARRVYARRHVEFDMAAALADERSTAAFMLLFGAHAFRTAPGFDQPRLGALLDASEHYAAAVSRSLKDGVLRASEELLRALVRRPTRLSLDHTFEQALTIVYRMLFLLFAEARGLVPVWHPVYRESYSVEAMRIAAERVANPAGLWDAIRAVCRLAHAGCRAGDLRVTPFNGRLFAPSRTPLVDRPNLDDAGARSAVLALSTRPGVDGRGAERIAYRDLGVEQLGSVYETLLDYRPHAVAPPQRVALVSGSGVRKTTGTFYTPQPLARYLVRRALAPLVHGAAPDQILRLRVLDPAMGSGAFLVAACAFLADAYEAALIASGACHPEDIGAAERTLFRRLVAERCLYGVDLNPMAVQLARLSLWLATLAADKPLSFLDHRLVVGNSLLGAWLSSLQHAPELRRRRVNRSSPSLFGDETVGDVLRAAVPVRFALDEEPNDTPHQVHQKERTLAALNGRDSTLSRWKRVADLWCSRWFTTDPASSSFRALSDAILGSPTGLPGSLATPILSESERIAEAHRFFHWELEFPEVFFDARGERLTSPGFDAILGNPPWDMLKADAGSSEDRARERGEVSATLRFTRDAGVYTCQSSGHANRYQLFVERCVALCRTGGRVGLILPWGLTSDQGSARLRRLLLSDCDLDSLMGFENKRRLFPIHRSVRFVLMTATRGGPTRRIACRFGLRDPAALDLGADRESGAPSSGAIHVTPALLERLSGEDLAIPDVRGPIDLAICERAASLFPPLGGAGGWTARFGRELNASDDRAHFSAGRTGLAVIEGKAIAPFRVDMASRYRVAAREAARLLGARIERPRLAYRDVASSTNRVTLIAAVLPAGCVTTHTVFCLKTLAPARGQHFLCGLFNSFVLNYLVRLRVSTHVTTAIAERLPVPVPDQAGPAYREIASLARLLARRDDAGALARLNACVARLYQLQDEEFEYLLGTFPLVPSAERAAALTEFRRGW